MVACWPLGEPPGVSIEATTYITPGPEVVSEPAAVVVGSHHDNAVSWDFVPEKLLHANGDPLSTVLGSRYPPGIFLEIINLPTDDTLADPVADVSSREQ